MCQGRSSTSSCPASDAAASLVVIEELNCLPGKILNLFLCLASDSAQVQATQGVFVRHCSALWGARMLCWQQLGVAGAPAAVLLLLLVVVSASWVPCLGHGGHHATCYIWSASLTEVHSAQYASN
jgi:hypothetical protein